MYGIALSYGHGHVNGSASLLGGSFPRELDDSQHIDIHTIVKKEIGAFPAEFFRLAKLNSDTIADSNIGFTCTYTASPCKKLPILIAQAHSLSHVITKQEEVARLAVGLAGLPRRS
jgi:hypothetical protein